MAAPRGSRSTPGRTASRPPEAYVRGGPGGCDGRHRPAYRPWLFSRSCRHDGRNVWGEGLRLAYRVAQVGHADARDHRRVAQGGWGGGEMVEESHSGAKEDRRDVDGDLVEEAGVQALLD